MLFDRYHRLVLHVALKIIHDVGEAEDVMQNAFMEIYKVAAQFDPARGTTKMWILRNAYHRSMNRRKQLQVRHFYASTDMRLFIAVILVMVVPMTLREMAVPAAASESAEKTVAPMEPPETPLTAKT